MKELTLLFHIKLKPLPIGRDRGYIFSLAKDNISITAFIKGESIFFGIPKCDSFGIFQNELVSSISVPAQFHTPIVVSFLYSSQNGTAKLTLRVNEGITNTESIEIPKKNHRDSSYFFYSIGGSIRNDNFGFFSLYETTVYSTRLTPNQLKNISDYFLQKGTSSCIDFNGNQFLLHDAKTGSLIQTNEQNQPKHVVASE